MQKTLVVLAALLAAAVAINNGVAKLPPMGWNTWYQSYCDVSEDLIISTIDALKKFGLDKYGYNYVNLDDCWAFKDGRDKQGRMYGDPVRFSKGIKYLCT
jgi:alpha-galactosidase